MFSIDAANSFESDHSRGILQITIICKIHQFTWKLPILIATLIFLNLTGV